VPHVLIASDAEWVHEEIRAALPGSITSVHLHNGRAVRASVKEQLPDLAVLDSQIASMGAIAVTIDLHNEESGGRLSHVPVLMILDRQADVFLAKNSGVEGYLVKPLDPIRVQKAINAVMNGGRFEDRAQIGDASTNYRPTPDATAR
jgi:DNA-binding NarL/FixJ family response regulator